MSSYLQVTVAILGLVGVGVSTADDAQMSQESHSTHTALYDDLPGLFDDYCSYIYGGRPLYTEHGFINHDTTIFLCHHPRPDLVAQVLADKPTGYHTEMSASNAGQLARVLSATSTRLENMRRSRFLVTSDEIKQLEARYWDAKALSDEKPDQFEAVRSEWQIMIDTRDQYSHLGRVIDQVDARTLALLMGALHDLDPQESRAWMAEHKVELSHGAEDALIRFEILE